jgi:glycosyltransferase involved in cell wall biosynthesis
MTIPPARPPGPDAMPEVHVVLPNDIDDPAAPSGGNTYDRRVCQGLAALGWHVAEHAVPGSWPHPSDADKAALAQVLGSLPAGALVLVDGLVASAVPDVLRAQTGRLRLVVLVHMPLCDGAEGEALAAARAVITTSAWTRRQLLELYALPAGKVSVATPGVDPAPVAPGSPSGGELLCVAAVTPGKGHDLLAEALAKNTDLAWRCVCAGPLHRDPAFVRRLCAQIGEYGLAGRMRLVGPRPGDQLYPAADLLVLPTRGETFGMVVTEALAHGIPVLTTAVGGVPEALGHAPDGSRPGILIPPDDPAALAGALRQWLGDAELRRRLRGAALGRRGTLTSWAVTSELVSTALKGVPA